MKKAFLLLIFLICAKSLYAYDSKSWHNHPNSYWKRKYFLAFHVDNPLSLIFKYGGKLELRGAYWATEVGYNKYFNMSAYPGEQLNWQFRRYIPTLKRNEYFIYLKSLLGTAAYDDKKMKFWGAPGDITILPVGYFGGSAGLGKRYNFRFFFAEFNVGLKYCQFVYENSLFHSLGMEIYPDGADKPFYKVLTYSGACSYIDLNFHIGLQL